LLRPALADLPERADLLLLAGDLTRHGDPEEAAVLAGEVGDLGVPTFAVLGNHDHHADQPHLVRKVMEEAGVVVLEGESAVVDVGGVGVGVAGAKGFGGGFPGACASEFGEPEVKAFVRHTREIAERLGAALAALAALDTERRVVVLHFSPVPETLEGERLEIYPFLGSYLLAEAVDRVGADLVVHGHAHAGSERGTTPGGVPVRNVSQPVIGAAYRIYCVGGPDQPACD
ncbi:MAG TPA: metallophosphoesterase family protein, partial [Acidimicrobiales bacterium]|nr:metallophosphoesterase family protein [Acidimicrobiales bacterium]